MTSSGTYKQTTMSVVKIIDRIARRCGKNPASLTPEDIAVVRDTMFTTMAALTTVGLNLWMVQQHLIGFVPKQRTYILPEGCVRVLNAATTIPSRIEGTDTVDTSSVTTELDGSTTIRRVGLKFTTIEAEETILVEYSNDSGATWSQALSLTKSDWVTHQWYWNDLDPAVDSPLFRVRSSTNPISVSQFYLATNYRDIPIYQFNRDDYQEQANKRFETAVPTNTSLRS